MRLVRVTLHLLAGPPTSYVVRLSRSVSRSDAPAIALEIAERIARTTGARAVAGSAVLL